MFIFRYLFKSIFKILIFLSVLWILVFHVSVIFSRIQDSLVGYRGSPSTGPEPSHFADNPCQHATRSGVYNGSRITDWKEFTQAKSAYDFEPLKYDARFRNPCWCSMRDDHVPELLCLPTFFLAGIEKCGTSDLYDALMMHPLMAKPKAKEPHFWGKQQHIGQDFTSYLKWFQPAATAILENPVTLSNGSVYFPKITGDGSPSTLSFQIVWRQYVDILSSASRSSSKVERIWTPTQLAHILPRAKYIVTLRNPVDRLYSSYLFYPLLTLNERSRRTKREEAFASKSTQEFHEMVLRAVRAFQNCRAEYSASDQCYFLNSVTDKDTILLSKLQMGIYAPILHAWFKVIPREQFHIVSFENYVKDRVGTVNEIFKFLDLPALEEADLERPHIARYGFRKENIGEMLPSTRQLLQEFYKPYNDMLSKLLAGEW